jgi:hypothetical protein
MVEACKSHPLRQVMPSLWGIYDGMTQLKTSGLQKGELLKLFSVLPLRNLPGMTLHRKLILKEDDLPGKAFGIFTSRG